MPSYNADEAPTIKVEIDFDRDGNYDDVTSDVLSWDSKEGFESEYQQAATPGTCNITLDNTTFKYSALNPNALYYNTIKPHTPVKITLTYPGGTYTPSSNQHVYGTFNSHSERVVFVGEIINFQEQAYNNNTSVLKCTGQDFIGRLNDSGIRFPPIFRIPPHTPIDVILDTEFNGAIAGGFWYFRENPVDGVDHLSLVYGTGDSIVYYFKNTLSGGENEILIGATVFDSIYNAYQAINGGIGAGTLYSSNIEKPAFCTVQNYTAANGLHSTKYNSYFGNDEYRLLEIIPNFVGTQGNTIRIGVASLANIWISDSTMGLGLMDSTFYHPFDNSAIYTTLMKDYGYLPNGNLTDGGWFNTPTDSSTAKFNRSTRITAASSNWGYQNNRSTFDYDTFSLSYWIRPDGLVNGTIFDFFVNDGSLHYFKINLTWTAGNPSLQVINWDGTSYNTGTIASFSSSAFNHICLTRTGGGGDYVRLYVNGVLYSFNGLAQPMFGGISSAQYSIVANTFTSTISSAYVEDFHLTFGVTYDSVYAALLYAYGSIDNKSGFLSGGTAGTTNDITPYVSVNSETYFGYIGDDWVENETTKLDAIHQIAASEFGRFFQSRDGQLVYWSNQDWLQRVNGYNVDDALVPIFYALMRPRFEIDMNKTRLYNQININFMPRIISSDLVTVAKGGIIQVPGQSGTERWNGTVVLPGGGSTTLKMDFTNPDTSQKCGAYFIDTPLVGGVNWYANEQRDLSGVDYTYYTPTPLTFSLVHNLSGAEITIKNTALGYLWVYDILLQGKIITKENKITYTAEDQDSIDEYGQKFVYNFDMPLDVDPGFAREVANWLLDKFKQPQWTLPGEVDFGSMYMIEAPNRTNAKHILDVEIMDEIVIGLEPGTDAGAGSPDQQFQEMPRFVVTQISYNWENRSLKTKFKVEACERAGYFVLDNTSFGILDTNKLGI